MRGGVTNSSPDGAALRLPLHELRFDKLVQLPRDLRLIEPLDDFVEEAGHEEALCDILRDATREQVEELVLVQLAGRGAMAALYVIGHDLEAGH